MTKRQWTRQLIFAILLSIICLFFILFVKSDSNTASILIGVLAAHSWYQVIRWAPK